MQISKVESFLLSYPLAEPLRLQYHGGTRSISKRDAMIIRVETRSGLVGHAPGPAILDAKTAIDTVIAPFLNGRMLAEPDALRIQFLNGPGRDKPALARYYAAVELALYDALGKALGVPISELVGGRVRDRIRLYGSGGMYMDPAGYAAEAAAVEKAGFRAYKMRLGRGPDADLESVRQMRASVGPDFDLMIDAHTWWRMGDSNYSFDSVRKIAEKLADLRVAWLEEPLPPEDHDSYVKLRELDLVPLASGEHEPSDSRFFDLMESGAVDYVQMDILTQGAVPTFRRIIPEIARLGLRFAFHSWGTALEVLAAAHLGITWPDSVVEWLEYPCYTTGTFAGMYPFPLSADLLKEPLEIDNGDLIVPDKPGLGYEIDESVIEKFPWIPGPWSSFEIDSPRALWHVSGDHAEKWS